MKEALKLALEALEVVNRIDLRQVNEAIAAIKEALVQLEQEPVAGEPAPENSLPTWSDCNLIIENDEFRKRAKAGLEGQVLDTPRTTPKPTALHYFIHEYDDADPYRSAWFLHRLECVLKEATTPPQRKPDHIEDNLAMVAQPASYKHSATCGEPVGHRDGYWCDDLTCKKCYSADFRFKHKNSVDKECLTTSPQRKPLTDEQIEAIWRDGIYSEGLLYEFNLFARAIEVAHGIKE